MHAGGAAAGERGLTVALATYEEAIAAALAPAEALGRVEEVDLDAAFGRALDAPIAADRDQPPFHRATLDGYALRAAEYAPETPMPVVATIAAGSGHDVPLPRCACVKIATGAPLPTDCDLVIPHERSDRGDPVTFTAQTVAAGQGVHARGSDARCGDLLMPSGTTMGAQHMGIAAAVGAARLSVRARPRVVILTTGDEVVDAGAAPHDWQIRNGNAPMLAAALGSMGAEVVAIRHVADDASETAHAVAEALGESDLLVAVGGVSAGERDFVPAALTAAGASEVLRGAAIQPGRPILVVVAGATMAMGLPGNPVSALACATLFAWPILRVMLGCGGDLPWRAATLTAAAPCNARREVFRPAHLQGESATVPAWQGSGDLAHAASTNGLARLPIQEEECPAGARVEVLPWPWAIS